MAMALSPTAGHLPLWLMGRAKSYRAKSYKALYAGCAGQGGALVALWVVVAALGAL